MFQNKKVKRVFLAEIRWHDKWWGKTLIAVVSAVAAVIAHRLLM